MLLRLASPLYLKLILFLGVNIDKCIKDLISPTLFIHPASWRVGTHYLFKLPSMCFYTNLRSRNLRTYQGWVVRRIRKIRRMVFKACFTILNKLDRIIRLQSLPFFAVFGLFRQFPPQQRSFIELPVLIYNILMTHNILEKNWERLGEFGANRVHFGSRIGIPKLHKMRYTCCVFNAYCTVLNVSKVCMTHSWHIL